MNRVKSAVSGFISGVLNGNGAEEYIEKLEKMAERYGELEEQNQVLKEELNSLEALYEESKEESQLLQQYREEIEGLEKELERQEQELRRLEQENKKLQEQAQKSGPTPAPAPKPTPGPDPAPTGKVAYLTFDDGPSHNTEKVLNILKDYGVRGTFFVCGNDTPFGHRMYKRMVQEGHAIGNHTYTHNYETIYRSPEAFMEDFYRMEELLDRVVGVKPDIMRFPGGSKSASALNAAGYDVIHYIIKIIENEGYKYFDWNVTSGDATNPSLSSEGIVKNVLNGAKNRKDALVLFHDSSARDTTVEALPGVIEGLIERGYTFDILTKEGYSVKFAR
ncbi:MAG: polysaccharide deacetylase family protein [Candidatus Contubernalis sp.]|nr:polysaccharide deacetylase family protein [Candidatus Contubernalis sp.]